MIARSGWVRRLELWLWHRLGIRLVNVIVGLILAGGLVLALGLAS